MRNLRLACLIGIFAAGACGGNKNAGTTGTAGTTGVAGASGTAGTTGAAGTTGSAGTTGTGGSTGGAVDASADRALTPFEEQALAIAAAYTAWGRVDDELRWAPFLCRQPYPGITRVSQSNDEATHGRKLYSVFAKNHDAYPDGPHEGQVVVKQSWIPELVTDTDAGLRPIHYTTDAGIDADHFYPYAQADGGVYRAGAPAGLFIMFRLDPATPDTDEGWVYATVSAAGQVTAAGRVASCMGCHETSATHERLYGVPLSPSSP
jgi:hypothetical protein